METNLTVTALLTQGIRRLRETVDDSGNGGAAASEAALDAEILLAHALRLTRTRIKSHPETLADAEDARRYAELIERRAAGEPIAYLLGRRDFWSLSLTVTPAVLVPRPETELLIERALTLGPAQPVRVADLGTGSGAIALALAHERPQWTVTATDLSREALTVARSNAADLDLRNVEFLLGSWFEPLANRRFELVLSNPPYIDGDDPALQAPALRHEPQIALTPGIDGMTSLRAIVQLAPLHLEPRGWLLLEHGAGQAAELSRELVERGFRHVRSHRDLAGHERMTEAQWV